MERLGINVRFLFVQLLFLIVWLVPMLIALFSLRKRKLSDVAQVLWALIIMLIPLAGAVAYWIVSPGGKSEGVG